MIKARILFLFLIMFFSPICSDVSAYDSCPSGMRKTYLDDLNSIGSGSARGQFGTVWFYLLPGSLYYSRLVLIEPRFEVHLKASVGAIDIIESSSEQKVYSFTIVISRESNKINTDVGKKNFAKRKNQVFKDFGYNHFNNAVIIEFNFAKDYNDPDYGSISIKYCGSSCDASDADIMVSKPLKFQKYIPGKKNEWDFILIYENKNLNLYSGPNNLLHSLRYDLENTLGSNMASIDFTGFMESNRGEINLSGTFICEDNYLIILF